MRPSLIDCAAWRRARKGYRCAGNGARGESLRAEGCAPIAAGDDHVEYRGEVAAFQSGSRHCRVCAVAYFTRGDDGK